MAKPAGKKSRRTSPAPSTPAPPAPTPKPGRTAATASKAPRTAPPPASRAPAILAEGDTSPRPAVGGPGDRFVLGPSRTDPAVEDPVRSLPPAYGTGRLLLVARDPRWIYAHWDLTDAQMAHHNRQSVSGHLTLRVFEGSLDGASVLEQEVHPESRNWFLQVPRAGTSYLAELGYHARTGSWHRVASSCATLTPADELSPETWVRFETVPFAVHPGQVVALVKEATAEHPIFLEALRQAEAAGNPARSGSAPGFGASAPAAPGQDGASQPWDPAAWTPEQERALAELVSIDEARRIWIGSLEITELLRRQLLRGISSAQLPITGPSLPGGLEIPAVRGELSSLSSVSSPFGGAVAARRGFRFEVNAELIIYGATEPDAAVTIGGRRIQLRPDGSFAYRFALPDGEFPLPIAATSADAVEQRSASLEFRRTSSYHGQVGTHPQDPALHPPSVDHVA